MLMSVVWIGHTLYLDVQYHKKLGIEPKDQPNKCTDKTKPIEKFGLTTSGKPIAIYEYTTRLARGPDTHVLKVHDQFPKHLGELCALHIDQQEDFWEMSLTDHEAESRCSFVR